MLWDLSRYEQTIHSFTFADIPGLEFLGAERVSDILDRVAQTVRVVIGWVDAPANNTFNCLLAIRQADRPFISRTMMRDVFDAVRNGVDLALLESHLQSQGGFSFVEFPILNESVICSCMSLSLSLSASASLHVFISLTHFHVLEQLQILLHRTLSPGRQLHFESTHFLDFLMADIGMTLLDQHNCPL